MPGVGGYLRSGGGLSCRRSAEGLAGAECFRRYAGSAGLLRARNKWLLAHPQSPEAAQGAWSGLRGENLYVSYQ